MKKHLNIIGVIGWAISLFVTLTYLSHLSRMAQFGESVANSVTGAEAVGSGFPLKIKGDLTKVEREQVTETYMAARWSDDASRSHWLLAAGIVGLIAFSQIIARSSSKVKQE